MEKSNPYKLCGRFIFIGMIAAFVSGLGCKGKSGIERTSAEETVFKTNAPVLKWQGIDWYAVPNAEFYGLQKAAELIHIQLNRDDMTVSVVNTHFKEYKELKLTANLYDIAMKKLWDKAESINIAENKPVQNEWRVPENKEVFFLNLHFQIKTVRS